MHRRCGTLLLLALTTFVGCSRPGAPSIGAVVTNMVQHAEAKDLSYFRPAIDAGSVAEIVAMVQRSGMATNYMEHLRMHSPTEAQLDYHLLERGCHFQASLVSNGQWRVTRIWLCR